MRKDWRPAVRRPAPGQDKRASPSDSSGPTQNDPGFFETQRRLQRLDAPQDKLRRALPPGKDKYWRADRVCRRGPSRLLLAVPLARLPDLFGRAQQPHESSALHRIALQSLADTAY